MWQSFRLQQNHSTFLMRKLINFMGDLKAQTNLYWWHLWQKALQTNVAEVAFTENKYTQNSEVVGRLGWERSSNLGGLQPLGDCKTSLFHGGMVLFRNVSGTERYIESIYTFPDLLWNLWEHPNPSQIQRTEHEIHKAAGNPLTLKQGPEPIFPISNRSFFSPILKKRQGLMFLQWFVLKMFWKKHTAKLTQNFSGNLNLLWYEIIPLIMFAWSFTCVRSSARITE